MDRIFGDDELTIIVERLGNMIPMVGKIIPDMMKINPIDHKYFTVNSPDKSYINVDI